MSEKNILITRTDCSYCTMAKELLAHHKVPYTETVIGRDISRDEVLKIVSKEGLNNTLPITLYNGKYYNYNGLIDIINKK